MNSLFILVFLITSLISKTFYYLCGCFGGGEGKKKSEVGPEKETMLWERPPVAHPAQIVSPRALV